jgi:UrcA family protein
MIAVIAKSAVTVTLAAAFIGHSVVAHADRIEGVVVSAPSITIGYAELDISKPQGLAVLYTRIKSAARSVCGFDHSPKELARGRVSKACYQTAVEDAVRQINRPTLTALHRAKSKSTLG